MIVCETQLWWRHLPPINATLNGISAILLVAAFMMIKNGRIYPHAVLMITALVTSTAFLACYLTYHAYTRGHVTPFPKNWLQPWYRAMLFSHVVLAVVILPLIARTLWLAWKRRWRQHHKLGMITFSLWLYVSVTGVLVYLALYHLAPTLAHSPPSVIMKP